MIQQRTEWAEIFFLLSVLLLFMQVCDMIPAVNEEREGRAGHGATEALVVPVVPGIFGMDSTHLHMW